MQVSSQKLDLSVVGVLPWELDPNSPTKDGLDRVQPGLVSLQTWESVTGGSPMFLRSQRSPKVDMSPKPKKPAKY